MAEKSDFSCNSRPDTNLQVLDDSLPRIPAYVVQYLCRHISRTAASIGTAFLRLLWKREKNMKLKLAIAIASCALLSAPAFPVPLQADQPSEAKPSLARPIGTVISINGSFVTLRTDAGAEVRVQVQDSTRMLRTAPGQKNLTGATPIHVTDVQVGDRMLVLGQPSGDGKSVVASSVIVMTKADVAARQQQEQEDWRERGVGGLVKSVDAPANTIALTMSATGAAKTMTIHISKNTVIRRYAPDSVKFDDAKPGTLDQIKPGDQLRARGDRNADGTELTAQEIVSGTFRNIAGNVISVDSANSTVTVNDAITKKPVTLKMTPDSQAKKLPAMFAQRIAARLKGGAAGGNGHSAGAENHGPPETEQAKGDQGASGHYGGFHTGNGAPDLQQILNRMPDIALTDLQKGDAVMIVATEGSANTQPAAITLLTGVEPILSAAPSSSQAAMLLSPWNLGGGSEAAAGANQ